MGLPVTRKINVSVTKVPVGLAEAAVNNIALFTNEAHNFSDVFRTYTEALSVETDFSTASLTAKMAQNVFAQSPNILSGNGSLVVIPLLSAVSATQGKFTTPDIDVNLANFLTVANGEFAITLNGATKDVTGLNFTNCTTLADIAKVIYSKLHDVFIEEEVGSGTQKLKFTSKKFGVDSDIAFGAVSGGTGTSLIGSNYLNTSTGVAVSGADATGETVAQAITRTQNQVFYVGVIDTIQANDTVIKANASAIQARDMAYLTGTMTSEDIAGLGTDISEASQTKTRLILHTDGVEACKLAVAAYAGRGFSTNFQGSNTCHTMDMKDLANVIPDSIFESTAATTIANACEVAGVDFYSTFGGVTSIVSTGGNDYFDNVYNDIWLKFALEVAGFNYLKQTNTKVIQTEQGMDGLKGAYNKILRQAVTNGAVAPGEWNSSQTFGNPETFKENVRQAGFYTYSQPIALQSQADRNSRKAPLCQIAAKRAGAIHSSDVIVIVEN